jgi:HK97 family phage major capsid protein
MRKSLELKAEKDEVLKVTQDILDAATADKPLTEAQNALVAANIQKVKDLKVAIEQAEFMEAEAAAAETLDAGARKPKAVIESKDKIVVPQNLRMRNRKLRHFTGDNAEQNAYASGRWIMATLFQHEASQKWCAQNGIPMVRNSMSEADGTKGGFLVPDVFERTIIDLREDYGVFRQLARIHPMASDYVSIPRRTGGLTAYPVGEGATITDSDKTFDQVNLVARKWAVLTKYSSELAEDAVISIAEDLAGEIAYAFAYAEDNAGLNGDGTSTFHGITGIKKKFDSGATVWAGAMDAASGHDTFAEIDATDLVNLTAKLPKYALKRAVWLCSQPAWSTVFQRLQAAAGGNSVMDVAGKMVYQYLGYPVVISQLMPTALTDLSDLTMLMFGDFASAVTMGTRRGVTIGVSSEKYFDTDQLAIRGIERFDINVHDIGSSTVAGPVVALIGE